MENNKKVIALILAGGKGCRMKQDIPKQFIHIENKPLIVYTMEAFEKHPMVNEIIVVCLEGWHDILRAYAKQFNITKLKYVVNGGETGQESIKKGIDELKLHFNNDDVIMIHDGNRGLVSQEIISDSIYTYNIKGSAVTAIPCTEAIFENENFTEMESTKEIPRERLFRTQTPQTYSLGKLIWAHEEAEKRGIKNTVATCSLMNLLGEKIYFSKGSEKNMKITTIEDLDLFKAILHISREEWIK